MVSRRHLKMIPPACWRTESTQLGIDDLIIGEVCLHYRPGDDVLVRISELVSSYIPPTKRFAARSNILIRVLEHLKLNEFRLNRTTSVGWFRTDCTPAISPHDAKPNLS